MTQGLSTVPLWKKKKKKKRLPKQVKRSFEGGQAGYMSRSKESEWEFQQ